MEVVRITLPDMVEVGIPSAQFRGLVQDPSLLALVQMLPDDTGMFMVVPLVPPPFVDPRNIYDVEATEPELMVVFLKTAELVMEPALYAPMPEKVVGPEIEP